jgi:opacity protein-like surface antigen
VLWVSIAVILMMALCAGTTSAQLSPGIQGSWGTSSSLGLGARLGVGSDVLVRGVELLGTFDYFFPGEGAVADPSAWEAGANLVYRIDTESPVLSPYGGAGLNIAHFSATVHALGVDLTGSETRTGVNVMGGLLFGLGRARPFVETRLTLGGSEQFLLTGGVRF